MKTPIHIRTRFWIDNAKENRRLRIITYRRACFILLPIAAAVVALGAWLILSGRFAL